MNKTSMYAIDRSEEYLAHYGIKGMKWGVRKAIAAGGTGLGNRKLARQYKKAQKKLAKLEKRANNGAKYARRAAALGAGAAAAGGLAAAGTTGVGNALHAGGAALVKGGGKAGRALDKLGQAMITRNIRGAGIVRGAGKALSDASKTAGVAATQAGSGLRRWGKGNDIASGAASKLTDAAYKTGYIGNIKPFQRGKQTYQSWYNQPAIQRQNQVVDATNKMRGVSNNQIARAGAAALGLGLAGAAGYNAYRAATTKRAAKKAAEFRKEMNKTFAGTAYGKQNGNKKRRHR